jgi:hypothetical protein
MDPLQTPSYTASFEDKTIWSEIKDEFKDLLKRHEIQYANSFEAPIFSVEYVRKADNAIKVVIQWPQGGKLLVNVHADPSLLPKDQELQQAHAEIFEFLQIWEGTFEGP